MIYNIIMGIIVLFLLYSIIKRKSKKCPNCGNTMYSTTYIGDGDGPAPDHIYYTCNYCMYTESELQ